MGDFKDAFVARFGADTKEFDKALKKLEKNTKASMEKVTAVTNTAAVAFVGLASAVALTTAEFIKFEKGLIGVQKTTNLSDQEIEKLGDDLINIAKKAPIAIDSLLSISEAAGQLGISGRENIVKFTDTIAKLGATTDLQGEEAAKTLARILNVTGENVDSVDKLGSAFVKLGNEVAASEAEIAETTKEVAKSTAIFGIGSANAVALGASLAELGIQAEAGGSIVGKAFIAIKNGIDKGGDSLKRFSDVTGIAAADLKQSFEKDATGVFVKLLRAIKNVNDVGGNTTQFLNSLGLEGIRVNKVLAPMALRVEGVEKNLVRASTEFENATALETEFALKSKSVAAQLEITKNKITAAQIALGDKFAPIVLEVTEKVGDLFESFSELDEGTLSTISQFGLAAVAFTGIITTIGLVTKAILTLRVAVVALGAGTGPFGLVVTALGLLATGVASFWLTAVDNTKEAEEKLKASSEKIALAAKKSAAETTKAWKEAIAAWKGESISDKYEEGRLARIKQREKQEKAEAEAAKKEVELLKKKEAEKEAARTEANRKDLKAREEHGNEVNAIGREFLRTQLELANEEIAKSVLALKRKNDKLREAGRTFLQEQQAIDAEAGRDKLAEQEEIEEQQVLAFQEFTRKWKEEQAKLEAAEEAHQIKMNTVGQTFLTDQATKDAAAEKALKDHYAKMIALNAKFLKDKEAQEDDAGIDTPITTGSEPLDATLLKLGNKITGLSGAISGFNTGGVTGAALGFGMDVLFSNEEFAAAFEELNEIIGEVLAPLIVELIPVLEAIGEVLIALSPIIEKMLPAVKTLALILVELVNLITPMIGAIDGLIEGLTLMFNGLTDAFSGLVSSLESLGDIFTNVGEFIESLTTTLSSLQAVMSTVSGSFSTVSASLTTLSTGITTLITGLSTLVTAVKALTSPLNSLKDAITSFNPLGGGGGGGGGGLGDLLGFQTGGFIEENRATQVPAFNTALPDRIPALLQPGELVVPKDTTGKLLNHIDSMAKSGKQQIKVVVEMAEGAIPFIRQKNEEYDYLDI